MFLTPASGTENFNEKNTFQACSGGGICLSQYYGDCAEYARNYGCGDERPDYKRSWTNAHGHNNSQDIARLRCRCFRSGPRVHHCTRPAAPRRSLGSPKMSSLKAARACRCSAPASSTGHMYWWAAAGSSRSPSHRCRRCRSIKRTPDDADPRGPLAAYAIKIVVYSSWIIAWPEALPFTDETPDKCPKCSVDFDEPMRGPPPPPLGLS